jgi:hypothetical protein
MGPGRRSYAGALFFPAEQASDVHQACSRRCRRWGSPADAKQQAASDLTTAAASGAVSIPISPPMLLEQAAEAHDQVDIGTRERILLALPD